MRSLLQAVKRAATTVRLRELPDELVESAEGAHSMLEIRSSQAKPEWTPPRVVRVGATYYRLEYAGKGRRPRPFVYRLRRLAAGVPGRNAILFRWPGDHDRPDVRAPV